MEFRQFPPGINDVFTVVSRVNMSVGRTGMCAYACMVYTEVTPHVVYGIVVEIMRVRRWQWQKSSAAARRRIASRSLYVRRARETRTSRVCWTAAVIERESKSLVNHTRKFPTCLRPMYLRVLRSLFLPCFYVDALGCTPSYHSFSRFRRATRFDKPCRLQNSLIPRLVSGAYFQTEAKS